MVIPIVSLGQAVEEKYHGQTNVEPLGSLNLAEGKRFAPVPTE